MTEERLRKIALIGATGYEHASPEARIECFPWNKLKKVTNLADYDVVILNLLSLDDPKRLDSGALRKMLDVRIAQEVLTKRNSAIFVLGDPRFEVEACLGGAKQVEPFLTWTGIEFSWDGRPSDTVERKYAASGGPFKPFADKLTRWSYSLAGCRPNDEEYAKVRNVKAMREQSQEPRVVVEEICENSYGNAHVFSVSHAVERFSDGLHATRLNSRVPEPLSGPIFFLPRSELSEEATLEFVLRDLCGVDVSAPEPEWVAEFMAPGQERVDRELAELKVRIEAI